MLFIVLFFGLIYGPHLWVKFVLRKHGRELEHMPGTGGELAIHLLNQQQLDSVKVEQSSPDDNHYSPIENAVRLSPEIYNGKSLTAVAVAAHEVGHAIQFNREEPVSLLRSRYLGKAVTLQRLGIFIVMAMPVATAMLHVPTLIVVEILAGFALMLLSVFMHAAVLPEEFDASFNKALPILKQGDYVPDVYMPAIRQVLKACALTYVAAALADVLRLWRWAALMR